MAFKIFVVLCLQGYLLQIALAQCTAGFGPSLGINPGSGQIGPMANGMGLAISNSAGPIGAPGQLGPGGYGYPLTGAASAYGHPNPGYGGSGSGDVAVAGELPVAGSTLVAGQVPVVGGVQFGGSLPAVGVVTITGTCSCGYGY